MNYCKFYLKKYMCLHDFCLNKSSNTKKGFSGVRASFLPGVFKNK
jgi:hypothetical protein